MKKTILMLFCGVLFTTTTSCKKSTDGNKNVVVNESIETKVTNENGVIDSTTTSSVTKSINGQTTESNSYTYKGLDGTRAKVTFNNSGKTKTVTIQANKNKFELDQKEVWAKGAEYERNGVKATAKGDSLIIKQGDNIIPLVLDK